MSAKFTKKVETVSGPIVVAADNGQIRISRQDGKALLSLSVDDAEWMMTVLQYFLTKEGVAR